MVEDAETGVQTPAVASTNTDMEKAITASLEKVDEKAPLETLLGGGLRKLMALVEDYPELKADQSFLQLQNDLTEIENHIQYARRYYNGSVRNLNIRIESFPDLLVAGPLGFRQQPFFELDAPEESHSPEIFKP